MPYKNIQDSRDCKSRWRSKNPDYAKHYYLDNQSKWIERDKQIPKEVKQARQQIGYARRRKLLDDLKSVPCIDCGNIYPTYCMEFDHARGTKEFVITQNVMIAYEKLMKELDKCDVVCANCHCIRTYIRAQNFKILRMVS